jgi:hypothetical protein
MGRGICGREKARASRFMTIIPPTLQHEQVQALPENVGNFINEWLKTNMNQLKKKGE